MQLPFVRFVKQVSNGGSFSKYGYIDLMRRNAAALESAPWHAAQCSPGDVSLTVGQLTRTDGELDVDTGLWTKPPSYTAWLDDRYDCFAQGGDAVSRMATLCGYAGCVAYRFTLPRESQSAMQSFRISVQRDRYLRAGIRIKVLPATQSDPNNIAWQHVRDGGILTASEAAAEDVVGVESWGFLSQKDVPYLLAGRATEGSWSVGSETDPVFSQAAMASSTYLWVFMTLEDPAAYWDFYNAKEMRYYYIEGSAVLVPSMCDFVFASADTPAPDDTVWISGETLTESRKSTYQTLTADGLPVQALWGDNFAAAPTTAIFARGAGVASWSPAFGIMQNVLATAKGGFMYAKDPGGSGGYGHRDTKVELRDLNTLASIKGDGHFGLYVLGRSNHTGDAAAFVGSGLDDESAGNASIWINNALALFLGYQPFRVPAGAQRYSRMRLQSHNRDGGSGYGFVRVGVDLEINVWRVSSLDAAGSFDWLALCALAKNPAFFTGANSTVSGNVYTEGDMPVGVSAQAMLVAQFNAAGFGEWQGSTSKIVDVGEVKPGEIVVLTPNIRRLFSDTATVPGNTSFPGFTPDGTFVYYGERFLDIDSSTIVSKVPGGGSHVDSMRLNLSASFT